MSKLISVRKSGIHGKGVFANEDIPKGMRIIEYKGELITDAQADARHPWNPDEPYHTFFFSLEDGRHCLDAAYGGNVTRIVKLRKLRISGASRMCISMLNAIFGQGRSLIMIIAYN
jgi:SET domain-containing protein